MKKVNLIEENFVHVTPEVCGLESTIKVFASHHVVYDLESTSNPTLFTLHL